MNCYRLIFNKDAKKFLKNHKDIGLRFFKAFTEISKDVNNNTFKYDIKKLNVNNKKNLYRLRISSYRAIFRIDNGELVILVIDIGSRGDIYKNLK